MKSVIVFTGLLLSIHANHSFSQVVPSSSFSNDWEVKAARRSNSKLDYSTIEGTPYYTPKPVASNIVLIDGSSVNEQLRYDMYLDEMEYKKNELTLWINKKEIKSVQYGLDLLQVLPLPDESGKTGYFFVQNTGKYLLYLRKSVIYKPYVPPAAYSDPIPEKFANNKDEFYINVDGGPLQKCTTKKALSAIFAENKPAMDFIKSEKIKSDDLEDLNKLVNFLNK